MSSAHVATNPVIPKFEKWQAAVTQLVRDTQWRPGKIIVKLPPNYSSRFLLQPPASCHCWTNSSVCLTHDQDLHAWFRFVRSVNSTLRYPVNAARRHWPWPDTPDAGKGDDDVSPKPPQSPSAPESRILTKVSIKFRSLKNLLLYGFPKMLDKQILLNTSILSILNPGKSSKANNYFYFNLRLFLKRAKYLQFKCSQVILKIFYSV